MKVLLTLTFLFVVLSCNKQSDDTPILPETDQFVTCEMAGIKGAVVSPNDSLGCYVNGARVIIGGQATTSSDFFILGFNSERLPGTYNAVECQIHLNGKMYSTRAHEIEIKVLSFGSKGGKIIGSYSGIINNSSTMQQVKGDFRLTIR